MLVLALAAGWMQPAMPGSLRLQHAAVRHAYCEPGIQGRSKKPQLHHKLLPDEVYMAATS